MKVFVIGIGLIGGSMAKDIKRSNPRAKIYGIDTNEVHLDEALALNIIDKKSSYGELNLAEVVIVSIPVNAMVLELPKILDIVNSNTLVFDAGSTKGNICRAVENHPNRSSFLACHPISGTEFSGPSAAIDKLFDRKANIICEVDKTNEDIHKKALDIFKQLGMRIRYMNPEAHDKHIAYVSHLSHISSFMLGKTVIEKEKNERDIFDMAGSGFESTVRLAKSSPAMWTPIFEQNKENVVDTLEEYIQNLEAFKEMLKNDDYDSIYNEMNNTNRIKEILNGIPQNKK
ncbi:prephenate dehydrogenase [Saonia flava]|uniref:Prephenate dehydrogenase n=1 Tax=Saonia flava TaxID=523696 RepID=A0A846QV65_9FLAO|nr:prephenate dehydrogenase [Saonia flava]NJB70830.1 prephenate dehydrogenase [Saonia flava]